MQKKVTFIIPPEGFKKVEVEEKEAKEEKEGCQCSKTNCLKLYCQCFHNCKECGDQCGCLNCKNVEDEGGERKKAIKKIIHKYREQSIQKLQGDTGPGCSCKKSKCELNYCECFIRGKCCGDQCRCKKCKNGKTYKKKQPKQPL